MKEFFPVNLLRLTRIELNHFKNVSHGEVELPSTRQPMGGSMLALYGQNGSGKTAMIDALDLLKQLISGQPVSPHVKDLIEANRETATLAYDFLLEGQTGTIKLFYEVELGSVADENGSDDHVKVVSEKLCWSFSSENREIRKTKIIDTQTSDAAFLPAVRLGALIKDAKTHDTMKNGISLCLKRQNLNEIGKSFVFSDVLFDAIGRVENKQASDWGMIGALLMRLRNFAREELFVISSRESSLIALDALILAFNLETPNRSFNGKLPVNLASQLIPVEMLPLFKEIIHKSNYVLEKLIPGLNVVVKELSPAVFENGHQGIFIQLMSSRRGREVCLQYESDGIKKIFSILHLLIAVYNKKTITVAIDEIDSGVFEYLLGELLKLLSEKAKGQIIFTCHNLRPLEMIDRKYIVFTTTDNNNRYAKLPNVKSSNNLRDFYYRELSLGDGQFYEHTNSIEISHAFKAAWKCNG